MSMSTSIDNKPLCSLRSFKPISANQLLTFPSEATMEITCSFCYNHSHLISSSRVFPFVPGLCRFFQMKQKNITSTLLLETCETINRIRVFYNSIHTEPSIEAHMHLTRLFSLYIVFSWLHSSEPREASYSCPLG